MHFSLQITMIYLIVPEKLFFCYLNNYPLVVRMTGVVASWQLANDLLPVSKRSYGYWQKSF